MVDMNERTMMFTLNGEVLLDDSGSELAFKDFEVWDGEWREVFSVWDNNPVCWREINTLLTTA